MDTREIPVRFSMLKAMARSPAHYLDAVTSAREESLAMRLGSCAHAVLLEKPVSVFNGKVRRGRAWDLFQEENAGALIVNRREFDHARRIVDAIRAHRDASALIYDSEAIWEQRIEWKTLGRACAGTPDVRTPRFIVDLKTTRCAEPQRFNRDGTWRFYHAQLANYLDGVIASGLGKPAEAYIVAVESSPPFPVTVLRLTDRAIDQGRRLCRLWFERLLQCEEANYWPGYVQGVVDFDVLDDPIELMVGGEKMLLEEAPALGVIDPGELDVEDVF